MHTLSASAIPLVFVCETKNLAMKRGTIATYARIQGAGSPKQNGKSSSDT